jgi:probable F420-dependent oxidoreductase
MSVAFGVVVPTWGAFGDPGKIRRLVTEAETLGFASIWVGDHLLLPDYATALSPANWYEAVSCCLVGLGWTERIRFGTDVLVAPYRDPRLLAKMAATADRLSGGRLLLGLGSGFLEGELRALGVDPAERGAITDEVLRVMRRLFEQEGPVGFAGRFFCFDPVHCEPKPLQSPLPLLVGGNGVRAQRRAALLGDGWHPLFPTPGQYAEGRAAISRMRAEGGREGPFTFSYSCPETRLVDAGSAVPRSTGYAGLGELPPDYAYAPAPPRDASGRPLFVGSVEQVTADLRSLVEVGVEQFVLRFWAGDPAAGLEDSLDQMRRFASEVAPRFHGAGVGAGSCDHGECSAIS